MKFIKELLFPKFCLSCGKFGTYICLTCQTSLKLILAPICFYCENESINGATHKDCNKKAVDQFLSMYRYNPVLKRIIAGIKYRLVSDAFTELFQLIDSALKKPLFYDFQHPLYIQPLPLHKKRLKERGFNQSELIAKWLAKKQESKVVDVLERVKETKTQAKLSKYERIQNTTGAFKLKNHSSVRGLSLILVDDVVTTGSTIHEAAKVLKEAGARNVGVFSIAKD